MNSDLDAAPADFQRRVHKALRCWHDLQSNAGLLDDLLVTKKLAMGKSMTRRQSTNLLLEQALRSLKVLRQGDADLLKLRFCDALQVQETRLQMNYSESTIYSKQGRAVDHLAAILWQWETSEQQKRAARLEGDLELPAPIPLVGVEAQVAHLCSLLTKRHGPWLVSIEGIGGAGKTAVAGALLHQLARTSAYAGLGWVSANATTLDLCGELHYHAKQTHTTTEIIAALAHGLLPAGEGCMPGAGETVLSALRQHLQQAPHVVVIDNVESVTDFETLLPLLHSLANPSKFILTSRRRLIAEHGVYLHCIPELSCANSLLLMRQAAETHNLLPVITCDDQELLAIYSAVGGNPLALLVLLTQAHVRPLHTVLADLKCMRTQPLATLLEYVMRQAWVNLGKQERQVLAAIPLAEEYGWGAEEISELNGLSMARTTTALQRLVQANLINTVGDLDRCHYQVHHLTRTFLAHVAPRWSREEEENNRK